MATSFGRPLRFTLQLILSVAVSFLAASCTKNTEALSRQHLQRGDQAVERAKFFDAIVDYRVAIQLNPRSAEAHKKLGFTYLKVNDPIHAVGELSRAADLLPNDVTVQVTAARLLQRVGRFEDATARAHQALLLDPKNVDATILLGFTLMNLKDLEGAVAEIEEAITFGPSQGRAYTALGGVELSRGRIEEADRAFRKAVALEPQSPQAFIALGYFLWSTHRTAEAQAVFNRALELDPKSVLVNRILATLLLTTNRVPDAEPYLKALAALQPNYGLTLADYYLAQNRFREAERVLVSLFPEKAIAREARVRFAALRMAEGHAKDATETIDAVLADEPLNSSALVAKAQLLAADDKIADAVVKARLATEVDPKNGLAHFVLGKLFERTGERGAAIGAFREVVRLNSRAVVARVELARQFLALDDPKSAKVEADQALKSDPDNPELRVLLARALLGSGETERAETEIRGLVKDHSQSASVRSLQGALYVAKNDLPAARRSFEEALALDHNNLDALSDLLLVDAQTNRHDEAHQLITSRLAKSPNDPAILVLAARTYELAGDLPSAEQTLKRVIAQDASNVLAYGMLGAIYVSGQRLEEARLEYEKQVARDPKSIAANTIVAMILESQNKTDQAKLRYERVLAIDPSAPVAANNLAWLYVDRDQNLDVALQLAQRAKQSLTADPRINDTLGWIYYKKDMSEQAVTALEEAVGRDNNNPLHQYHLGMAYIQAGDWDRARRSLERALTKPEFPGAQEARKALTMVGG